jgi:hypothetical protein
VACSRVNFTFTFTRVITVRNTTYLGVGLYRCTRKDFSLFPHALLLSRYIYLCTYIYTHTHISMYIYIYIGSRDSVVGIATRYGLEGPGIESRWGEILGNYPDRLRGPPSLLYNGYRVFPGDKGGRGVMLTTHPLLVPRLRKI